MRCHTLSCTVPIMCQCIINFLTHLQLFGMYLSVCWIAMFACQIVAILPFFLGSCIILFIIKGYSVLFKGYACLNSRGVCPVSDWHCQGERWRPPGRRLKPPHLEIVAWTTVRAAMSTTSCMRRSLLRMVSMRTSLLSTTKTCRWNTC